MLESTLVSAHGVIGDPHISAHPAAFAATLDEVLRNDGSFDRQLTGDVPTSSGASR